MYYIQHAKLVTRGSLDIIGLLAKTIIITVSIRRAFSSFFHPKCSKNLAIIGLINELVPQWARQVATLIIPLFKEGHLEVKWLFFNIMLIKTFCSCYLQVHGLLKSFVNDFKSLIHSLTALALSLSQKWKEKKRGSFPLILVMYEGQRIW